MTNTLLKLTINDIVGLKDFLDFAISWYIRKCQIIDDISAAWNENIMEVLSTIFSTGLKSLEKATVEMLEAKKGDEI